MKQQNKSTEMKRAFEFVAATIVMCLDTWQLQMNQKLISSFKDEFFKERGGKKYVAILEKQLIDKIPTIQFSSSDRAPVKKKKAKDPIEMSAGMNNVFAAPLDSIEENNPAVEGLINSIEGVIDDLEVLSANDPEPVEEFFQVIPEEEFNGFGEG